MSEFFSNVTDIGAASDDPKRNAAAMLRDLARLAEEGKLAGLGVAFVVLDDEGKPNTGTGAAPCCDEPNLAMLLASVTLLEHQVVGRFETT